MYMVLYFRSAWSLAIVVLTFVEVYAYIGTEMKELPMKELPVPLLDAPIHVLASLGSEFLERLQFGRSFLFIYLFILPSPIYTGNLVGQMYRFTFFLYKKILGSSSFLVRNATWFLQGRPFFLLHDVWSSRSRNQFCLCILQNNNVVLIENNLYYERIEF